jgi:hypothetical protein
MQSWNAWLRRIGISRAVLHRDISARFFSSDMAQQKVVAYGWLAFLPHNSPLHLKTRDTGVWIGSRVRTPFCARKQ